MSFNTDPHKLDSFWVERAKLILRRKNISPEYRKRLEAIKFEAMKGLGKEGTVSNHYPNHRK